MHHANMKNISLKLFQNEHDSVKEPEKKAKKHVTSVQKIGPAKERNEGQEKRKKRGGEKRKVKVNTVVLSKLSVRKHYFVKTAKNF